MSAKPMNARMVEHVLMTSMDTNVNALLISMDITVKMVNWTLTYAYLTNKQTIKLWVYNIEYSWSFRVTVTWQGNVGIVNWNNLSLLNN